MIDDGWHAAGTFVVQGGVMKLAALSIFPGKRDSSEVDVRPGDYVLQTPDVVEIISQSALTSTILDQSILKRLHQKLIEVRPEVLHPDLPIPLPFVRHSGKPGGTRRDDCFYLPWALRYVELIDAGETHPNKALADQFKCKPAHVRDQLNQCRTRGLITKPGQGRSGGTLTKKGIDLWKAMPPAASEKPR